MEAVLIFGGVDLVRVPLDRVSMPFWGCPAMLHVQQPQLQWDSSC